MDEYKRLIIKRLFNMKVDDDTTLYVGCTDDEKIITYLNKPNSLKNIMIINIEEIE